MKMDDKELKRILQEGMEYEADRIMEEVESDPSMKDVVAPEEVFIKLKQQIHEHQVEEERERENRTKEDEELIRLGMIYKKKRSRRKYYVLLVAVLCALGIGTVSFGDGKKVFTKITRMFGDKGQTVVNTDDGSGDVVDEISSEEEAYEQINEKLGFYPVRMLFLPEQIKFTQLIFDQGMQGVRLYYDDSEEKRITYYIATNYREGSIGIDIEDKLVGEYIKQVDNREITIQEYRVEENGTNRYLVSFNEQEIQYWMLLMGMEINEVEKIVEKLYFS